MLKNIETATEISTAQKIAVGLVVATATMVLLSALAAAFYTLGVNLTKQPTSTQTTTAPVADYTFATE